MSEAKKNGVVPRKIWYAPNQFEAYGEEEIKAVTDCLRAGWLAPGPRTAEFEEKVSKFFGKKFGVFVNSGSSANVLAFHMAGCKEGDEVITPSCTFSTVVAPMKQMRIKPVFCDVELKTFVPTVDAVLACITEKTKAIMLPNLAGSKPDWKALRERLPRKDIVLIEDSCDTMTYTEESDISVISFYASHVMTAGGGGGMVMCNTKKQKDMALMYRDWGRIGNNSEDMSKRFAHDVDGIKYDFKFLYGVVGYNFKSTEMNAAFGLVQLKKLPKFLEIRRRNVERYIENLKDTPLSIPDDSQKPNWLALPLLAPPGERVAIMNHLEDNGVQTRVFFAGNITRHPAYREYLVENHKNADIIMRDVFMLGAHHGIGLKQVDYVCDVLKSYFQKKKDGTLKTSAPTGGNKDDACDF
mmetsp:Transcript_3970/g.5331  ORF Transcript_3970/g.5331 Transcript_3970/m.5331 type:complete len:411 (-) Transcript_3970:297-1529(-)